MPDSEQQHVWNNILRAVQTEPHELESVQGASGLSHPVHAVGIDETRRRVVIISNEGESRATAMAHADIQAAMPSLKVITARPISVNFSSFAKPLVEIIGKTKVTRGDLDWLDSEKGKEKIETLGEAGRKRVPFFNSFDVVSLLSTVKEAAHQLSVVELETGEENKDVIFDFSRLAVLDPVEADLQMGICPLPLYEFSKDEAEVFKSGASLDDVQKLLREHDVLQYFFPAADQLALGIIDQSNLKPSDIVNQMQQAPGLAHPFGEYEIIDSGTNILEVVGALCDKDLAIEGEFGWETTPEGEEVRAKVKFKPREGFLSKLSKVFSFKAELNFKDLFDLK